MRTEWDYTNLADAYLKRPAYALDAINAMLSLSGVKKGDKVCDVGAGAAHLTLNLAAFGLDVYAVEPNDAMRANGIKRTERFSNVKWFEGVGEETGMEAHIFDLVTFGSSFNVCDRSLALIESQRILKKNGWFACMWNHRDLDDPLQKKIEDLFKKEIADYRYGNRREDQTEIINASGLFGKTHYIESKVIHSILAKDFVEGWRSHGTLERQAKSNFERIIKQVEKIVMEENKEYIVVPYTTRIWMAQENSAL